MSPLKGNAIAIFSVLLSSTSCIYVKVIAEYTFQVNYVSTLSLVYSSDFSRFISEALMERSFSKKTKKESYEKASRRSWRPRVAGCQKKKNKNSADSRRKAREKEAKGEALRRRRQERQLYDEMVVKGCLLKQIKDPYRETLRDAIEIRVDSYSKSIVKASSGLMHLAR